MVAGTQMAEVAALVGDPGRASMLATMMDGRAHSAGELAIAAGVSAATASGHLNKLREGHLVEVAAQGRHRYYRLASAQVAQMLEGIMVVTAEPASPARATPRVPAELREARTCYDHLAGRLGVAIADALIEQGALQLSDEGAVVTERGAALFAELGIDVDEDRGDSRRPLCRSCLDWSERRPHVAGHLGSALLERFLALGWIERVQGGRAINVTASGAREFARRFGWPGSAIPPATR